VAQKDKGLMVYSLKDFKLKMKIGRKGEGSGVIKRSPYIFSDEKSITLSIKPELYKSDIPYSWFWLKQTAPSKKPISLVSSHPDLPLFYKNLENPNWHYYNNKNHIFYIQDICLYIL